MSESSEKSVRSIEQPSQVDDDSSRQPDDKTKPTEAAEVFKAPLIDLPEIPSELKSLKPYIQRAKELQFTDRVMCYWCLYYAAKHGVAIRVRAKDSRHFLFALMELLETFKKELSTNVAVNTDAHARTYVRTVALRTFNEADNEDRNGRSSRSTAEKFLAAADFSQVAPVLDLPRGALTDAVDPTELIKYARWKASDIAKAIREGRIPHPGPPADLSFLQNWEDSPLSSANSSQDELISPGQPEPPNKPKDDGRSASPVPSWTTWVPNPIFQPSLEDVADATDKKQNDNEESEEPDLRQLAAYVKVSTSRRAYRTAERNFYPSLVLLASFLRVTHITPSLLHSRLHASYTQDADSDVPAAELYNSYRRICQEFDIEISTQSTVDAVLRGVFPDVRMVKPQLPDGTGPKYRFIRALNAKRFRLKLFPTDNEKLGGQDNASTAHSDHSAANDEDFIGGDGIDGIDEKRPLLPSLHLYPLNDTFAPKQIVLWPPGARVTIGRQTNAKTIPSVRNGYFDSRSLNRRHAEVWEEGGKIFIKDVKSSNGTFVNGARLSPEGVESKKFELMSDDVVEFSVDILGEDLKTIIHHKVAARVRCVFNPEDINPLPTPHQDVSPSDKDEASSTRAYPSSEDDEEGGEGIDLKDTIEEKRRGSTIFAQKTRRRKEEHLKARDAQLGLPLNRISRPAKLPETYAKDAGDAAATTPPPTVASPDNVMMHDPIQEHKSDSPSDNSAWVFRPIKQITKTYEPRALSPAAPSRIFFKSKPRPFINDREDKVDSSSTAPQPYTIFVTESRNTKTGPGEFYNGSQHPNHGYSSSSNRSASCGCCVIQ